MTVASLIYAKWGCASHVICYLRFTSGVKSLTSWQLVRKISSMNPRTGIKGGQNLESHTINLQKTEECAGFEDILS